MRNKSDELLPGARSSAAASISQRSRRLRAGRPRTDVRTLAKKTEPPAKKTTKGKPALTFFQSCGEIMGGRDCTRRACVVVCVGMMAVVC